MLEEDKGEEGELSSVVGSPDSSFLFFWGGVWGPPRALAWV